MDYLYFQELYHHGIKGQKWGVRNFQNQDGTLTAEGKTRYGYDESTGKMSRSGKKQFKEDTRNQSKIDNPYKNGVKSGFKVGGAVLAGGIVTKYAGLALANVAIEKADSVGLALASAALSKAGQIAIVNSGNIGFLGGLAATRKNIKLGEQQKKK